MTNFPENLVPAALEHLDQVKAFAEGQRMRADYIKHGKETGGIMADKIAKALFRDGRQDTPSVLAETQMLRSRFPETWQFLAAGLAPEIVSPDGKLLKL